MPYQSTPSVNLADIGLVLDQPSNSTAPHAWSEGSINMRARDGSVQGVNAFEVGFVTPNPIVAITQWTPSGSSFLNVAFVSAGSNGLGEVFVYNSTNGIVNISNSSSTFTIDEKYPPQIFVFNELLIMNPGTGVPQYASAGISTSGTLQDLPGWLTYGSNPSYPAVARIIRPFGNRLMAMNFLDNKGDGAAANDSLHSIDLAWSSNITNIASLASAQWQISTTNTAGDAFLTSTPGPILDGGQLGDDFMAYKTDSVVRVGEIGEPLVLSFESVFEDDGIYSPGCFANIGNSQHVVMGNYGVYSHDGQAQKEDIGKGLFQEYLFNDIVPATKDRTFVFQQTRDKEVWFIYRSSGIEQGCDKALVFDYNTSKIHLRDVPDINAMYETEVDGMLDIYAGGQTGADKLSNTVQVSGGNITLARKTISGSPVTTDVIDLHITSEGSIGVSMAGSHVPNATVTYPIDVVFDPSTDYKQNVRVNGKYISIRFTMPAAVNPKLTNLSVYMKVSGKR